MAEHNAAVAVRLVPSIALDYEARGIFPDVRLRERPGRVPKACDVHVAPETALSMLEDAKARPGQLRKEQPQGFKGGAVVAWHSLVDGLEWALLPKEEREAREQAAQAEKEARDRGYEWFIALDQATRHPVLRDHLNWARGRGLESAMASLEIARSEALSRPKCAMRREMRALCEGIVESNLERRLDAASWRDAGAVLKRAAQLPS